MTIRIERGDVVLVLRENGDVDISVPTDGALRENGILAFGLKWSLDNESWRTKLTRKAYYRIQQEIEKRRGEAPVNRSILEDT